MVVLLDDIIYTLQRSGGITTYWMELGRRISGAEVLHVGFDRDRVSLFASDLDPSARHLKSASRVPLFLRRYLPVSNHLLIPHIFHSSYYRYTRNHYALTVTTVHDFAYEDLRSGLPKVVHHYQKAAAVARSSGIICVSETTARRFHRYFPRYRGAVRVIYNGASDDFHPLEQTARKRQVLYVGGRTEYKNFDAVVDAVGSLSAYRLVFVGGGGLSRSERSRLTLKLGDRFLHREAVEASELNWLYNESHCLVYPSSYEGFGIPVAEAMKAGCPAVVGTAPVLREIAHDAGIPLDNVNSAEIARQIILLENDSHRNELIRKGRLRASRFSWDTTARETMAFYEELLKAASIVRPRRPRRHKSPDKATT